MYEMQDLQKFLVDGGKDIGSLGKYLALETAFTSLQEYELLQAKGKDVKTEDLLAKL